MTTTEHTLGALADPSPELAAAALAQQLDVALLERSFDLIDGEQVVARFYEDLFAHAPALRALFPDVAKQRTSLLATLAVLRRSLRDLPAIAPTLRGLGAKHVRYGAVPEHYPLVAQLLVSAMAEAGASDWTPAHTTVWSDALTVVAAEMLAGAETVPATAATRG